MELLEKDLAEWLGVSVQSLHKTRRALGVVPAGLRPVRLDEKNLAAMLPAVIPAADVPRVMEEFRARAAGRVQKKARVLKTQWRNPKLLRALLLPEGTVVGVRVKNREGWRCNAEIQVIPTSGAVWEIDPDWNRVAAKRARKNRRAVDV
jgi:hypothetical protein